MTPAEHNQAARMERLVVAVEGIRTELHQFCDILLSLELRAQHTGALDQKAQTQ